MPFSVGDMVTANEAWIQDEQVLFNTGREFEVLDMQEASHPSYPDLLGWYVEVSGFSEAPVFVLDWVSSGAAYKRQLGTLLEQARKSGGNWLAYYGLLEYYADLRPTTALTAHKSQGSTFRNVFVDVRDIYSNRIKSAADRALYVAITRASKNVFLIM